MSSIDELRSAATVVMLCLLKGTRRKGSVDDEPDAVPGLWGNKAGSNRFLAAMPSVLPARPAGRLKGVLRLRRGYVYVVSMLPGSKSCRGLIEAPGGAFAPIADRASESVLRDCWVDSAAASSLAFFSVKEDRSTTPPTTARLGVAGGAVKVVGDCDLGAGAAAPSPPPKTNAWPSTITVSLRAAASRLISAPSAGAVAGRDGSGVLLERDTERCVGVNVPSVEKPAEVAVAGLALVECTRDRVRTIAVSTDVAVDLDVRSAVPVEVGAAAAAGGSDWKDRPGEEPPVVA